MSYYTEANPHFFWEEQEQPLRQPQRSRPHGFHGKTSPEWPSLHGETSPERPLQSQRGRSHDNPHFLPEEQPLRRTPPSRPHDFHGDASPERSHWGRRPPSHGSSDQTPVEKPRRGRSSRYHGLDPQTPPGELEAPPVKQPKRVDRPLQGQQPWHEGQRTRPYPQGGLHVPPPHQTKPVTWFTAVFCAVFWMVVVLGGLIVLIVYLLFRPRSPWFDVSGATLNTAYLDMNYLLNADLSALANFTNPNKKVSVEFRFVVVNLYYEDTLISTRSIYPFSAEKMQTMFANVEMVGSQVPLTLEQTQNFTNQMMSDQVLFTVKGIFRVRSTLGGLFRYSYWLYGKCNIVMSRPPTGVLLAKKCKTKR